MPEYQICVCMCVMSPTFPSTTNTGSHAMRCDQIGQREANGYANVLKGTRTNKSINKNS